MRNRWWIAVGAVILGGLAGMLLFGMGGGVTHLIVRCITCH